MLSGIMFKEALPEHLESGSRAATLELVGGRRSWSACRL
jgi:hypothetical protein